MDRNFFLAIGLSFAVLVLWTLYTEKNKPPSPPPSVPEALDVPAAREGELAEASLPPSTKSLLLIRSYHPAPQRGQL